MDSKPTQRKEIGIWFNPISSSGKSESLAKELAELCTEAGLCPHLATTAPSYEHAEVQERLTTLDALVVVGGDGTVRRLLEPCAHAGIPFYMLAAGNESLFARSAHMGRDPSDALAALQHGSLQARYFATVDGHAFSTMATMGHDSCTVAAIGARRGRISNWHYGYYGLKTFLSFRNSTVSIRVDDQDFIHRERGYVVLAKDHAFARNLDPIPDACGTEPFLWVGFIPGTGHIEELRRSWYLLRGKPLHCKNLRTEKGRTCTITIHKPRCPLQADGDLICMPAEEHVMQCKVADTPVNTLLTT